MMLKTKSKTQNIVTPIIGRVTRNIDHQFNEIYITEDSIPTSLNRFKAVLTNATNVMGKGYPLAYNAGDLNHLHDGDVVVINTDGVINTLYRVNSHHNFMLFTERCNSNCLMCSQPPKDKDDTGYFYHLYQNLIPLIPKDCFELGITGGEPTLLGNLFFDLLQNIQTQLPDTEVHCLTNGRTFAWPNVAQKLGEMKYDRLMLGIPLYSDVYHIHDYVVQAKNAFHQTIQGLYNLASYGQRLEIRIVLHQQTIPRLKKLAQFIYKNLPFVEHVAFMGLEYQGYTPHNIDKLWIDPAMYQQELSDAVCYLDDFGMNVSIYNAQLCILPENLWRFAKRSISDWKNVYLDECNNCSVLEQCGGLFASGVKKHSAFIKAI